MKSRAARVTLLFLFLVALGTAAYLFRAGESLASREASAARAFDEHARQAVETALLLRAAQQAYVAAGQNVEFWSNRVAAAAGQLRTSLASLREGAISPEAQSEVEQATATLASFTKVDKRARDYARASQNLLASDLIFGDGLEMIDAIAKGVERARAAELPVREAAVATFHSRQLFALLAAAAAALLVVLLLVPRAGAETFDMPAALRPPEPAVRPLPKPADVDLDTEGWAPARPIDVAPAGPGTAAPAEAQDEGPGRQEPEPASVPAAAPAEPPTDFRGVAALCTELARITDTRQLPALLEQAASLLDASGIIVWIADPDGRELSPILAQGYPPQLVNRLGVIHREAENATAAAFRTSLTQTVHGEDGGTGAIAAPLVTPAGCVGVMAAEVHGAGEKQDGRLAAAAIVAAQLATLVGPPVSHQAEVAGA